MIQTYINSSKKCFHVRIHTYNVVVAVVVSTCNNMSGSKVGSGLPKPIKITKLYGSLAILVKISWKIIVAAINKNSFHKINKSSSNSINVFNMRGDKKFAENSCHFYTV